MEHFVIITGYDDFEYARQALRLQIDDYLLKPVDQKEQSVLLQRIATQIIEEKAKNVAEPAIFPEGESDSTSSISQFEQFISSNYVRDLSLEEVAEHLKLHPNYLCTLLKRKTGLTFVHYLRMVRIENAKLLLSQSNAYLDGTNRT
ncbi:AraC family transcriptional regulator [Paenibacillus sp. IHB B 3415]|uniref:AraC family transcriptional regulator n=1 Tax=Paenibacillus sp. IHB B 3415 TaxID=867080 RepID=UPI000699A7B2|nr:AraC family transcriptional regulator [Paenibacillus sp. IHB B 3415]